MSKHNIQNRDHYVVAGRERPGKAEAQVNPRVANHPNEDRERWEERQKQKQENAEAEEGSSNE